MAPTPFAVSADYTARGYDASAFGSGVLDMRLAAASRFVRAQCADIDRRITDDELDPALVTDIVCLMVHRSTPADSHAGLAQVQQTAGPFSQGGTVANPHGDLYLTKAERKSLGCGGQVAFTVPLGTYPVECDWLTDGSSSSS